MSQLFEEFPSFPISALGQPTAWRLERGFCSSISRHHPLLTQFSFPGDTERPLCPTLQVWLPLPAWALHRPPTGLGELCGCQTSALQGQGQAPQRWLGQDLLCMGGVVSPLWQEGRACGSFLLFALEEVRCSWPAGKLSASVPSRTLGSNFPLSYLCLG